MPRLFTSENAREMQLRSARSRLVKSSRQKRQFLARSANLHRWYVATADPLSQVTVYLRYLARLAAIAEAAGNLEESSAIVARMYPFERLRIALKLRNVRTVEHYPVEALTSPEPASLMEIVTSFSPSEVLATQPVAQSSDNTDVDER